MPTRLRDVNVYGDKYGICAAYFISHFWYRERKSQIRTLLHSTFPFLRASMACAISGVLHRIGLASNGPFTRYDAIIDLNSDSLNEYYGGLYPLFALANVAMAKMSGKPVIVSPCSIGEFKNLLLRCLARTVLDHVEVVMVRDETSRNNLAVLGVTKPRIVLSADLAFLMKPKVSPHLEEELGVNQISRKNRNPLVGITPSGIMHHYAFPEEDHDLTQKYEEYISCMAEITDFIVQELKANVILIPHSLSERGELASFSDEDDRIHCERIHALVKNKQTVTYIKGNYSAQEIKWLIGACEMFIGCRMHSTIASTSICVPTIAVAYGQKFEGIIGNMVGQSDQIVRIDIDRQSFLSQMRSKIVMTWANKDMLRNDLEGKMLPIKNSANSIVVLLKELLRFSNRSKST